MDQLIWGIVKSDQPTPLKGAFLEKISSAATYGGNATKECKAIIDTCLQILYPGNEDRSDVENCFVNDRVEGVLTTWVQVHSETFSTKKPVKIGQVVVMKTLPPHSWRLGRVEALVGPGKKVVKGATLVTRSSGLLVTRPLQEIIPLGFNVSDISKRTSGSGSGTQNKIKSAKCSNTANKHQCGAENSSSSAVIDFAVTEERPSAGVEIKSKNNPGSELKIVCTTETSVDTTQEASKDITVQCTSGEPSDEPNVEANVETSAEPSVEVEAEPTNRRGRKRRGSAVTGEVKRRYNRRK